MIRTYKLAKILSFITKDPYFPSLSPVKDTVNNRAWKHIQLNGVIQYNAPLKGNPVRDDWNIQTSKDP